MSITTKTVARDLPNGDYVELTIEERDDSGRLSAGFSTVVHIWEARGAVPGRARKRLGREQDGGGMAGEEEAAAFPQFAPIIRVHLADQSGLPLHAVANGWYFYTGSAESNPRGETNHERAARYLRLASNELPEALDLVAFKVFVDSLAERYAAEAEAARAVLHSAVDGQGVEQVR